MATQLIQHERIRTTLAKAKELRRVADKLVTLGKKGDFNARRYASAYVRTSGEVDKLFGELGPRYAERQGGYTRVLRCGLRKGDAAPMAIVEFVDREGEAREAKPPTPMGPRTASAAFSSRLSAMDASAAPAATVEKDVVAEAESERA